MQLGTLHGVFYRGIGGDDDHRGVVALGADAPEHLRAGELRQLDIEEGQVKALGGKEREGVLAVGGGLDLVSLQLQAFGEQHADVFCVVDDQDLLHGCKTPLSDSGRVK